MPWIYERNERMMVPFQSHKRGEREKAASRDSKSPPEAQGSVPLRCTPRFLTSTICFSLISSLSGMHFAHLPWQMLGSAVSDAFLIFWSSAVLDRSFFLSGTGSCESRRPEGFEAGLLSIAASSEIKPWAPSSMLSRTILCVALLSYLRGFVPKSLASGWSRMSLT
jgi:hypothetical protein